MPKRSEPVNPRRFPNQLRNAAADVRRCTILLSHRMEHAGSLSL